MTADMCSFRSCSPTRTGVFGGLQWWTIGNMWARWLALAATAWTGGYATVYLILVHHDGNSPVWWYVGLLAVGMVPLIATAAGWLSRPALIASAVALAFAALLGLLSIGLLLLPSVVTAIVAASMMKHTTRAAPEPR